MTPWRLVGCSVLLVACDKVPITNVNAAFELSYASWFEEEETLFFFYRVRAEQGLGSTSQVEITYLTDDEELPWTAVSEIDAVHTHVPVDCGPKSLCGSTSLHVARTPRRVEARLRYHEDGAMALTAPLISNLTLAGPAHSQRSVLIYGVFDESNRRVQWRARHKILPMRNEEVEALGLRRYFEIDDQRYGVLPEGAWDRSVNEYGYGFAAACPAELSSHAAPPLSSEARAAWSSAELPVDATSAPVVCARATVRDARGTFTTAALARKNPDVRPAFPLLRSPIRANRHLGYMLAPCNGTISSEHRQMQEQRLGLQGAPVICVDDWQAPGFVDGLVDRLRADIDTVRAAGEDMVLTIALHHDDRSGGLAAALEAALEQVLPFERDKSSPRVSGAFVFDTFAHRMLSPELSRLVLWCPADVLPDDLEEIPETLQHGCPVLPDDPELRLGPFRFSMLPILPTRAQYLSFVQRYSEGQAGDMRELTFLAPERTPISDNVSYGEFGVATFFNDEVLTLEATDVLSACRVDAPVVFRSAVQPTPAPLVSLPEVHAHAGQPVTYELGLAWDFPFLLRMTYEVVLAGAATAFSLTVPFGIGASTESYLGAELWLRGEFRLDEALLVCSRFCEHPTFDSAGVYNVQLRFDDPYYRNQCYLPRYPVLTDGGFPRDP